MANAALERNVTVQWCYATPAFVLQALNYPAVTNFRGSFDYYYGGSYNVGFSSLLIWALGSFPSKDTFWTSDNSGLGQKLGGCGSKGCPADHSNVGAILNTLVALFSMGPMGFSDAVNQTNPELLMKSCRKDGLILKPSKPMTSIDAMFNKNSPKGQIYSTYAGDESSPSSYYFLGFQLTDAWDVRSVDFFPRPAPGSKFIVRRYDEPCSEQKCNFQAFTTSSGDDVLFQLNPSQANSDPLYPNLYIVTPTCANGFTFLGELSKFVTTSSLRFPSIECTKIGIRIVVKGVTGEKVQLYFSTNAKISSRILTM